MLKLKIAQTEFFDEATDTFVEGSSYELELEHSLFSLSKWESIFEKPFLGNKEKTPEEILKYVYCMILTPGIPENVIQLFSSENMKQINQYIEAKHTATWFNEFSKQPASKEVITSELVYYWMFSLSIPIECEHWNLNRLLTLIKVFQVKNNPPKKMSRSSIAARNRQLNEMRRAQLGTSG